LKVIQVKLNPESVDNAIKELNQYRAEVESKSRQLVQRLLDLGVDIARAKVVAMDAYYTGQLLSGVGGYYSPTLNAGWVKVTSDHAAFVEFGTGVVGQAMPHPNGECLSKASWSYASGAHIFTTKDGVPGWYYPTDDGGYRFTSGQESRPFMYETALVLQMTFPSIAKEVFGT
jgi:hypothetical protein